MKKFKSPLVYFFFTVGAIALMTLFGPEEKSLGANVRLVYLHGAWVLAAEAAFFASAAAGLIGLLAKKENLHNWSAALGRAGIVFWVTYLPLSLLAMQANWNGLFLAEPRFRLAMIFAVTGVLLQAGLWIFGIKWLTSLGNILYIVALRAVFSGAENIMHPPPSPIFSSGLWDVVAFFLALNLLAWVAVYFLTRWFLTLESK